MSATHFAFYLADGAATVSNVLYRGSVGADAVRVTDLVAPFGGLDFAQEIRIDTLRTAAWLSTQRVQAVEADGTTSVIAGMDSATCSAAVADVVGDDIFVECGGSAITSVYVQHPGGALEPLLDTAVRSFGLDSDGTDMAWFNYTRTGDELDAQIWTSPHASRATDVRARLVADVPPRPMAFPVDLRVGFGYVAALEAVDLIGVYRLADGARAELRPPEGEAWNGFVQYIGPDEIAVTAGVNAVPATDRALMFIRLDSLEFVP